MKISFVSGLCVVLLFSLQAFAQVEMYIFDFDGTLVENRQVRGGTFNSKIFIYRNEQRLNLLQSPTTGPKLLQITAQDYHRLKDFLGDSEGRPGAINREVELLSGEKIRPGEFYLRYPDSFTMFRENEIGANFLLEDFKTAIKLADTSAEPNTTTWKGPMWDLFQQLCSSEAGAEKIAILTARGQSDKEWDQLFDYMKSKKMIAFKPNVKRVFGVTRPEFDRYSGKGGAIGGDPTNIPARKAGVIEELLLQLGRVDVANGKLHSVFFADDEREILDRVAGVFRKIAFGNQTPVKMILANTGLATQIRESGRPEIAMIEPNSASFRSVSRDSLLPNSAIIRSCEVLFTKGLK